MSASTFAEGVWCERVEKVQKLCDALLLLPQAHIQYVLLRSCLDAARVNDLLRAAPVTQARSTCARFSALLRDTFSAIVGSPVTDVQWPQATLAIRHGGLGLHDPVTQRLPARIGCSLDYARRAGPILQLPTELPPFPGTGLCV